MPRAEAIIAEVHAQMVLLRTRNEIHSDSGRLASAIRTIAKRRSVRFDAIEAELDGALAYRRS